MEAAARSGGTEQKGLVAELRKEMAGILLVRAEDLLASAHHDCAALGRLRKPFDIDDLLALVKPLL